MRGRERESNNISKQKTKSSTQNMNSLKKANRTYLQQCQQDLSNRTFELLEEFE